MLKKILFTLMLINLLATPTNLFARGGFGSGFGLGLLGGALITSAAYNNNPGYGYGYPGYGYYPPYPYAYGYPYGPGYY